MLKQKSFVRKTKRGTLIKVIKEHYLRDDISCGFNECSACTHTTPQLLSQLDIPHSANTLFPASHYLVPDTNVLFHQIDLIETPAFTDIILLQTVLDELRHRSLSIYARVRRLAADPLRRIVVFSNEHCRGTAVDRIKGETMNDRNDRAIRVAVEWYASHTAARFVLLTDDAANRTLAMAMNIQTASVQSYVEGMTDHPGLVDILSLSSTLQSDKKFTYPQHLSALQITTGLRNGLFVQGTLGISMHNYLEGSVFATVDGVERTVMIVGREMLNRGMQGDVVCVEVLAREDWGQGLDEARDEEDGSDDEATVDAKIQDSNTNVMEVDAKKSKQDDKGEEEIVRPLGRVIGIIRKNTRPYCGTIDTSALSNTASSGPQTVWFWALDRRIPKIRIRTRQASTLANKRIIVQIDAWPADSKHPSGHFVRMLGDVGEKATETEVLLLEHDVPFTPFTADVLASLPSEGEGWLFNDERDLAGREDFRHLDVCSIDPPGCTDIDDALHAKQMANGNFEVGVHIADVSHFVKGGNAMDEEAARRGTSVYLVDRRIDMLPGLLGTSSLFYPKFYCSDLCSLRSDVDRLAFSCVWEMTADAEIVSVRYTKSVIRSRNSFTYDAAQARLVDPYPKCPIL